ncbi:MAG: hypothetical protein HYW86_02790 [Candidatus Roizmanbacteria bacterium]|nr:MAG: hypothetical protein HYW86_02790 [Candidatus Roizmanbacteria bacterium]
MPQTFCQTFRERLKPLADQFPALEEELKSYISNPYPENDQKLTDLMSKIDGEKQALIKEYQQHARDLLMQWYPYTDEEQKKNFMQNIGFEDNQRVVVNNNLHLGKAIYGDPHGHRTYEKIFLPNLIRKVAGILTLQNLSTEFVDYLEEVDSLTLNNLPYLKSMARLKKTGSLHIHNIGLKHLDSLEETGGYTFVESPVLKSLNGLKKTGNFDLSGTNIRFLPALEEVHGDLVIGISHTFRQSSIFKSAAKLRKIKGALFINKLAYIDFEETFPQLEEIGRGNGSSQDESVSVSSEEVKEQVLKLQNAGKLKFTGELAVVSN